MRKVVDDPRLIYKCCKLYYEEERGQQEIADMLGVSRVSISRLLRAGREAGMVKIHIVSPNHLTYTKLEQDLENVYRLKEAVVVENNPLATTYDHITAVSNKAIGLLESYLRDGDVVGVSMGMTLHNLLCGTRTEHNPINCTFVPIIGGVSSGRTATVNIHSNQIALNFAQFFGGQYVEFFASAIFSDIHVLRGFLKEAPMQSVLQYYEEMKTVIMGIGTSNRNGDTSRFDSFNARVAGMPLRQQRTVENRICIGCGIQKAEAVYGALRGGYINILITDHECALKLLELAKEGTE